MSQTAFPHSQSYYASTCITYDATACSQYLAVDAQRTLQIAQAPSCLGFARIRPVFCLCGVVRACLLCHQIEGWFRARTLARWYRRAQPLHWPADDAWTSWWRVYRGRIRWTGLWRRVQQWCHSPRLQPRRQPLPRIYWQNISPWRLLAWPWSSPAY